MKKKTNRILRAELIVTKYRDNLENNYTLRNSRVRQKSCCGQLILCTYINIIWYEKRQSDIGIFYLYIYIYLRFCITPFSVSNSYYNYFITIDTKSWYLTPFIKYLVLFLTRAFHLNLEYYWSVNMARTIYSIPMSF